METEIVEITQDEISNIARKAFIRGQMDSLHNLNSYFKTFKAKVIKVEDLTLAINEAIKIFQSKEIV